MQPYRIVTDEEVTCLPPQPYLVTEVIPAGGLAVLVGPASSGKTFLASDLAFAVATGQPWLGTYATRQGPVLYIMGEGFGGLRARILAWKQVHQMPGPAGVSFLLGPVKFDSTTAVDDLIQTLEERPLRPALIVVDTLARCMTEDENSSQYMGRFLGGVARVQIATNAAALLLHHTGHDNRRERGSSALRAAADTVMMVGPPKSGLRELHSDKQRDAELFDPIPFRLESVTLDDGTSSCVVRLAGSAPPARIRLSPKQAKVLQSLQSFGGTGVHHKGWLDASGVPRSTFSRMIDELLDLGLARHEQGRYFAVEPNDAP